MNYRGIAFFDMDGVLANCSHRLKWADKDYDKFYAPKNIAKDTPIQAGIDLFKMFRATGHKIIIITSRRTCSRTATMDWLDHYGLDVDRADIYTRADGDHRKSWAVKLDLTEQAIQDNMDEYMSGRSYFIDDYPANCNVIAGKYASIQTIIFGCGRLNDKGGEL